MRQKFDVGIELKENEQNSMIPHEIINEIDSIFESYYIKFWRIYVTIGVSMFYMFIIRSMYYVLSPSFSFSKFSKFKNKSTKNFESIPTMEFVESNNEISISTHRPKMMAIEDKHLNNYASAISLNDR